MRVAVQSRIAQLLAVAEKQVMAAISLLDDGATVPFIARYRKEATGGLDDTQLRLLDEKLHYFRELDSRRDTVLESIDSQGKLTDELRFQIETVDTRQALEDIYLPYKPKRRTKAQIAREAGLEPLAEALLENPDLVPEEAAADYLNPEKEITDTKAALEGARHIIIEKLTENAQLIGSLRDRLLTSAILVSHVIEGNEVTGAKFSDYFDYQEKLDQVVSHRALAMLRGQTEGVLRLSVLPKALADNQDPQEVHASFINEVAQSAHIENKGRNADAWLWETVRQAWRLKLLIKFEIELIGWLREKANIEAISVFSRNLKDLLLAAPAGERTTLALDPGFRTGVKVAIVDSTSKILETGTIYPHEPRNDWQGAIAKLAAWCQRYSVELIAIGNGTASRETENLVTDLIKQYPDLSLTKAVVSEAGASVYSASETAAKELPELDVSLRGAVSIGRRLQDPLAELVKIDPKSIGVGQYQHDLPQTQLSAALDTTVEDCVNAVGVDVNTASAALLSYISGLSRSLAEQIVNYRNQHGRINDRAELKKIPRLGDKAFEQSAGFLRIREGNNPLDASAVHPEAYPVVEKIVADIQKPIDDLMGNASLLKQLKPERYIDERFGLPTVMDIITEMEKPGRDPRPEFETAHFDPDIQTMADLKPGQQLNGVVTNVANFGAFVDIGVHQDGLVHISEMADRFVSDPREVVRVGEIVKVRVIDIDLARKRIQLSMRADAKAGAQQHKVSENRADRLSQKQKKQCQQSPVETTAMAAAFAKLKQ